ncbi:hypothetical protein [Liquorilactobacillus sucicola]|uniref:hypothetical protein n=1 Tax=Liquorilactobacillus TaxID=2767888 RepID=UPI000434DA68|nr:hypothetical protein [Liquorilactobacillus sucicola]GAJ26823.1 hypothetical protein JCM15457_1773 [Liquorilactobacillus sucicola DSM 21376 = JCM 15457]
MRIRQTKGGYSEETFIEACKTNKCLFLLGAGPLPVNEYDRENKKFTKKIVNVKIDVYFSGCGVQEVKLPKEFSASNLKDLSEIELVSPEACVVNKNVYVRAKGVK